MSLVTLHLMLYKHVKKYTAISNHRATRSYELDVAEERFLAYKDSVRGVLKAQSVETHELGYIAFDVV